MSVKLNSIGGGSVTLQEPNTASARTLTLPDGDGTVQMRQLMTAQTASGSSVDFTGIPSWVKRITVIVQDISFAAAGASRLRIGTSAGLVSTGYTMQTYAIAAGAATTSSSTTDGLGYTTTAGGAGTNTGTFVITNVTGNTWVSTQQISRPSDSILLFANGFIALSGVLDRVSLVATTSTFDAGTINVLYEG